MKAGIIPVEAKNDRWTLARSPRRRARRRPRPRKIAAALSLDEADLASEPRWVSTGRSSSWCR
jgi:predicted PhzF superfamily epimerase YddE/YHI9